MKCSKHPKYQAKRAPAADCEPCRQIWSSASKAGVTGAAAKLIAARRDWCMVPDPPDTAVDELSVLVKHNDSVGVRLRVSSADAIEMLRGLGWAGHSRESLDSLCRRRLGRKTYATP